MPAPHRRNHGMQGLADQIAKVRHTDNIADARDRAVASRSRHAKDWESAAAVLDRAAGSDLERRAVQARTDYERASHLSRYERDVQKGKAKPPPIPEPAPMPLARFVLDCIDCNETMPLFSPKPRLPLCRRCRVKREWRRINRRRERAQQRREREAVRHGVA